MLKNPVLLLRRNDSLFTDPLFSLQSPAHVRKKRGGFIDHQRKGVWVGEEENRYKWGWFLLFSRAGGHKTKETYPTRPVSPTPCKQGLNFFFFLAASALVLALRSARSRALADVFEKNEKKNKTTTVYRLT